MAALDTHYQDGVQNFLDFMAHTPINSNAAFILVMGITGSGKSTFVSRCTGQDVQIGHDLRSCTQSLAIFRFNHEGRDIYLIDIPGFDDTENPDDETLGILGHFLVVSYANRRYIDGIIYLHRISDNRVSGSNQRNINMLKSLCGQDTYHNIVVSSTMWNSGDFQIMLQREEELLSNNSWLGSMCGPDGATYFRHAEMGSGVEEQRQSALEIVSHFFRQDSFGPVPLQIQHELVDAGKSLLDTQAGQAVLGEIGRVREDLQKRLNELNQRRSQTLGQHGAKAAEIIETLRDELRTNSAVNDRAHQMFSRTLQELHEQEKHSLLDRMSRVERSWAMEINMLQKKLDRSRAELKKTRTEALRYQESKYELQKPKRLNETEERSVKLQTQEKINELQKLVTTLENKHRQVSAAGNQKIEAHRRVRRVLADGTISGTVSGVVGAMVAGSMCVLM